MQFQKFRVSVFCATVSETQRDSLRNQQTRYISYLLSVITHSTHFVLQK